MKKFLQAFIFSFVLCNFASAQTPAIVFTSSTLSTAEIGTTVTVAYRYSIASPGKIYCAIEKQNGWTWVETVVGRFLDPVSAGTDLTGTINLTIPTTTTPTASLPSGQNYKIKIQLRDGSNTTIAGQYPSTEINLTPASNSISFTGPTLTTAVIGSTLSVPYQYTLANPGKIYCGIELYNGTTYVSTVGSQFIDPVSAGTNVAGTATFTIPTSTVPTASLPSGQNYKIKIELRNSSNNYLDGKYPSTQINLTPAPNSISFTGPTLTTAVIGSTLSVPYQYTLANPGKIYCGIELYNGTTYVSTVGSQFIDPVSAGTNVAGTATFTIPTSTVPTASLPSGQNYKIKIQLRDGSNTTIAGQYPSTEINLTPAPNSISFTGPTISSATVNQILPVTYQYTLAADGQIYCGIELYNGTTYVSTVVGQFLSSVSAGTNVSGTINLTIPSGTTPTASLPSGQNYKIKIELRNSSGNFLDGRYPSTQINITDPGNSTSFNNNSILVYPNPATDVISIDGLQDASNVDFIVTDILGKNVSKNSSLNNNQIDVSSLTPGIYFLLLNIDNSQEKIKFIKN